MVINSILKNFLSSRRSWLIAISLLWGLSLVTGCSPAPQQAVLKRETGRHAGEGVPAKFLSRVMVPEGKGSGSLRGVRVFDAPFERVFKVVRKVMSDKEYRIQKRDVENGIIETDYRLHDGLFALGFLGKITRSKIVAKLNELKPQKTKVELKIFVEEERDDKTWQHFPISDYDLDLIDSDSIEIYFQRISEQLGSHVTTGS